MIEHHIKDVSELEFTDDYMFGQVMKDNEICKGVIERLLQIKLNKIEYIEPQKVFQPFYQKHGIRLDAFVTDSDRIFDVEMQTVNHGDIPQRSRYYQSLIDADTLLKGKHYSELKESYIMFICLENCFNINLPVYTFKNQCLENPAVEYDDKSRHLVYNCRLAQEENIPERRKLMEYFQTHKPCDDFSKRIDEMVSCLKMEEAFCHGFQVQRMHDMDLQIAARDEGRLEGEKAGKLDDARKMLHLGMDIKTIVQITELPLETIQSLQN